MVGIDRCYDGFFEFVHLFYHIGTGKTGTSSLQQFFHHNQNYFSQQNIHYLGVNLELVPNQFHEPWMVHGRGKTFFKNLKNNNVTIPGYVEKLYHILQKYKQTGAEGVIMINEAIHPSPRLENNNTRKIEKLMVGLRQVAQAKGITLHVIAYYRSHYKYLLSSYMQWSIRHKTYDGKLLNFQEWLENNPINYSTSFKALYSSLGREIFEAKDFESLKDEDIVADFFSVLQKSLPKISLPTNKEASTTNANSTVSNSVNDYLHFCASLASIHSKIPLHLNNTLSKRTDLISSFSKEYDYDSYLPSRIHDLSCSVNQDEVNSFVQLMNNNGYEISVESYKQDKLGSLSIKPNLEETIGVLTSLICDIDSRLRKIEAHLLGVKNNNDSV